MQRKWDYNDAIIDLERLGDDYYVAWWEICVPKGGGGACV